MAEADRAAPEPEALIARAGAAVARCALRLTGGGYGRRVVVVAGKGNNGADGRVAAARLRRAGMRVAVLEASGAGERLPSCDLVVDAAYGTGFRGEYRAPDPGSAPVLAVDIPSGVDGLTGAAGDGAVRASRTITFAALKPGLLLSPGAEAAGTVAVADIGLALSVVRAHLVERADAAGWLPERPRETHKWASAVWVVAGSPGMTGAADLASRAALRTGAGTVRLGVLGGAPPAGLSPEVVQVRLPDEEWDRTVADDLDRFKALVVGPGVGRAESTVSAVRRLLATAPVPTVVDADALYALGSVDEAAKVLAGRPADTVLTPHDGEYRRLVQAKPSVDRFEAARELAAATGAVVLLKGRTTVVAEPGGKVLVSTAGDSRMATAGSGDVLAGMIGALLAGGLDGWRAAATAAFVHGSAGDLGWRRGLTAGDIPDLVPAALEELS